MLPSVKMSLSSPWASWVLSATKQLPWKQPGRILPFTTWELWWRGRGAAGEVGCHEMRPCIFVFNQDSLIIVLQYFLFCFILYFFWTRFNFYGLRSFWFGFKKIKFCVVQVGLKFTIEAGITLNIWICQDYRYTPPHLFYAMLGIKPRVLYMLGKHSSNWITSPAPDSGPLNCGAVWRQRNYPWRTSPVRHDWSMPGIPALESLRYKNYW